MKKKTKPLGKVNEARRRAEAAAMFPIMLKAKHTVITPSDRKGTRAVNLRKAISDQL